jgi:hypothetical protein
MVIDGCKQQGIEQSHYRFSRRDVRAHVQWSDFQVKKHMQRLQEMEYVLVHRGGRGQSFVYELLYQGEGEDGNAFLLGLKSMEKLGYDEKKEPLEPEKEPSSSPQVAAKEPPSSGGKNGANPSATRGPQESPENPQENASLHEKRASYRTHTLAAEL